MAEQQRRVKRLFNEFENQRSFRERRRYVESEIVRMIEAGEFSIVDLMNQRPSVRQMAGDVIFGISISDGRDGHEKEQQITGQRIDPVIRKATVHIRSVDGRPIRYVDGAREVEGIVVGETVRHEVARYEDNWIELSNDEHMPLREAWLTMKNFGKYVAWADTAPIRADRWRYEEVDDRAEQPETRKPKRGEAQAQL